MRLKIISSLSSLALIVVLAACAGEEVRGGEGHQQAQHEKNCRTVPRTGKRTGLRVCES